MEARLDDSEIRIRLVPLRLILGAMIAAIIGVALVATWFLSTSFEPLPGDVARWLLVALVAVGAGELLAWPILRRNLTEQLRRGGPPTGDEALSGFFRIRVLGAALAEGFAMFGLVAYLVTGTQLALLAPAVGIFCLLRLQPDPTAFREFARSVGVVDPASR